MLLICSHWLNYSWYQHVFQLPNHFIQFRYNLNSLFFFQDRTQVPNTTFKPLHFLENKPTKKSSTIYFLELEDFFLYRIVRPEHSSGKYSVLSHSIMHVSSKFCNFSLSQRLTYIIKARWALDFDHCFVVELQIGSTFRLLCRIFFFKYMLAG